MDRRAHIVTKSGKSQLLGPGSAANTVHTFHEENLASGAGQLDGSGQPVWSGADYGCVEIAHSPIVAVWCSGLNPIGDLHSTRYPRNSWQSLS